MKIIFYILFVGSLAFLFVEKTDAQSPYQLEKKKELILLGTGATLYGLQFYPKDKTPILTLEEIMALNPDDINGLDRPAIDNYSTNADKASDYLWLLSAASPAAFLATKKGHTYFGDIATLYLEAYLINRGLTELTKYTVRRIRPFVYNEEISPDEKMNRGAKASFFSGHTSETATYTFFSAKVFDDLFPDSKWRPVVWGMAATIPAVTGYLRIKAGKHYPTDVITGYAIGATIGWLVPHLHRNKKLKANSMSLSGGLNGVRLQWTF